MIRILFGIIATLGLLSALGTVLSRNLIHAALYLVAFFFLIACQFILLEAELLAAVQVLVYIGAVAILLMFGIMLTRNIQGDETTTVRWPARVPAALAGLGILVVLVYGIGEQTGRRGQSSWSETRTRPSAVIPADAREPMPARTWAINDMARWVGVEMMTRFVIPFEVAGLLLTAALVGAIALATLEGPDQSPRSGSAASGRGTTTDGSGNGQAPPPAAPTGALLSQTSEPR